MITADGPYEIWIDAETGAVLQLLARFYFANNAKGLVFNPDPNAGAVEMSFEVDSASGGKYTLKRTGVVVLTNSGTDGATGIVQVTDDGSGTANFNVSPINGTTVEHSSQSGYNGKFQQVNVFAHIFNERQYYMLIGSEDFGQVNVTFNISGNNSILLPAAVLHRHRDDGFVVDDVHGPVQLGPAVLQRGDRRDRHRSRVRTPAERQPARGGRGHGSLERERGDGGLLGDDDVRHGHVRQWWVTTAPRRRGPDCAAPSGGERRLQPPEHADMRRQRRALLGQIIAWANWSTRQGMNDVTGWGKLNIDLAMIKGMTTAGIGSRTSGRTRESTTRTSTS